MAELKNTATFPVALPGGRVLAAGEIGDADPDDAQVAEEVRRGFLTEVQSDPAAAEQPKKPLRAPKES